MTVKTMVAVETTTTDIARVQISLAKFELLRSHCLPSTVHA
jgi:hypothetical protein